MSETDKTPERERIDWEMRAINLSSLLRRIFHWAQRYPDRTVAKVLELEPMCQHLLTDCSPLRASTNKLPMSDDRESSN